MVTKKILTLAIVSIVLFAAIYLLFQLNGAYEEFTHWKSREAVLEKELEDLRTEANDHRQFLEKLRETMLFTSTRPVAQSCLHP